MTPTYKERIVCSFLLALCVIISVNAESFFNVDELSSLKYGMKITNDPVLFHKEPAENELYVSSKHGQQYSCILPKVPDILQEEDDVIKDGSDIIDLIDKTMNGTCLKFHKGWWSYKLCHKKKIEQYHMNDLGKIEGKVTLLGLYSSEDDWATKDKSGKKSGMLRHNQNYVNGTECDLTNNPRKATVQYYCSSGPNDQIIRVEEPATCEYVISVHVKALCSHTLFKEKENKNEIALVCSPALLQHEYDKYLAKKKQREEKTKKIEEDLEDEEVEKDDKTKMFEKAATQVNKLFKSVFNMFGNNKKGGTFHVTDLKLKTRDGKTTNLLSEDVVDDEDFDDVNEDKKTKLNKEKKGVDKVTFKVTNIFGNEKTTSSKKSSKTKTKEKSEANPNPQKEPAIQSKASSKHLKQAHMQLKGRTEKSKKTVKTADEITRLENENKDLLDETDKIRVLMKRQYELVRESAKEELQQAEKQLESLQKEFENANTDEEREEISEKIDASQEYIAKFREQIKEIENGIEGVSTLEHRASKRLKDLQSEITKQKVLSSLSDTMKEWREDEETSMLKRINKLKESKLFENYDKEQEGDVDTVTDTPVKKRSVDSNKKIDIKSFVNLFKENIKTDKDANDKDEDVEDVVKETEKQWKDNLKVRVRSADKMDEKEGFVDDDNASEDVKEATKKMEASVKKQLKDAGIEFGDNIKVKIITSKDQFDKLSKNTKEGNLLSDNDASKFKDLLLGFLGGGAEKSAEEERQQSLEENYNFKWEDGDDARDMTTDKGDDYHDVTTDHDLDTTDTFDSDHPAEKSSINNKKENEEEENLFIL